MTSTADDWRLRAKIAVDGKAFFTNIDTVREFFDIMRKKE